MQILQRAKPSVFRKAILRDDSIWFPAFGFSMIGFVMLLSEVEKSLFWLPHYKEVQLMSFSQRTNIVILLAVASLVLIFEHVVSVPANLEKGTH